MNKIIVNSLAINYADQGTGPIVLLLHGWGINLGTFEDLAARLCGRFRVIRLDLPGFGASERPRTVWGVGEYAELVAAFASKLKLTNPHAIVGHSFGGRIAIKGLSQGALAADKLVLVDSAGIKNSATPRNQAFKFTAKAGKALLSLPFLSAFRNSARARLYASAGSTDYLKSGAMKDTFLKTINEDLQADGAKLKLPVLMIWGEHDDVTPLGEARVWQKTIPNARLEIVKGAHHFAYLDEPEQVGQLITEFLA